MAVETHIDRARQRVRAEREAVEAKIEAIEAFVARIEDIPTESITASSPGLTATAGVQTQRDSTGADGCRLAREAFTETIQPHSVADIDDAESLTETIRAEFNDTVAVALAPTTEAPFTPQLKRTILAETKSQRNGAIALQEALEREHDSLDDAAATVGSITGWIVEANETPLDTLEFDRLAHRHETLEEHRDRCVKLADQRQAVLHRKTANELEIGIRHRSVLAYLYRDFPVDHPVLSTVVRLRDTCRQCQRAVRRHLIGRV